MTIRQNLTAMLWVMLIALPALAGTRMLVHHNGETTAIELAQIECIRFDGAPCSVPGSADRLRYLVESFKFISNYPNPFNPSTTITYSLEMPGLVDLKVFDMQGREVAALVNAKQDAGSHQAQWDGKSATGVKAASGAYLSRLTVNGVAQTRQLLMLK